jgi:hypothetical protein
MIRIAHRILLCLPCVLASESLLEDDEIELLAVHWPVDQSHHIGRALLTLTYTSNVSEASTLIQNLADESVRSRVAIDEATRIGLRAMRDMLVNTTEDIVLKNHQYDQDLLSRHKAALNACDIGFASNQAEDGFMGNATFSKKQDHEGCRHERHAKYQEMVSSCDDLERWRLSLTPPECQTPDNAGMRPYFAAIRRFVDVNFPLWREKDKLCRDAVQALTAKDAECDMDQGDFESLSCSFRTDVYASCAEYTRCYADMLDLMEETIAAVKNNENSRKMEWSAVQKIKCHVEVLLSTEDLSAKEKQYASCQNTCVQVDLEAAQQDISENEDRRCTKALDISYPGSFVPIPCNFADVEPAPCSINFVAQNYAAFDDNSPVQSLAGTLTAPHTHVQSYDRARCTPCPDLPLHMVEVGLLHKDGVARLEIGSSDKPKKCIDLPAQLWCPEDGGNNPNRFGSDSYPETFVISVEGQKLCAQRTDVATGWRMVLRVPCYEKTRLAVIEVGRFASDNTRKAGGKFLTHKRFAKPFAKVPVVVGLMSFEGNSSANVWIMNVSKTGFDFAVIDPGGIREPHAAEGIDFIAVEPGVHEFGGTRFEAGLLDTSNTVGSFEAFVAENRSEPNAVSMKWDKLVFTPEFAGPPVLLTSLQTARNIDEFKDSLDQLDTPPAVFPWLTVATTEVTNGGAKVSLDRIDVSNGSSLPKPETIGYIALAEGSGRHGLLQYSFQTKATQQDSGVEAVTFHEPMDNAYSIGALTTRNGDNGGWLHVRARSRRDVTVVVDDTHKNSERSHKNETVSMVAFNSPFVFSSQEV